MRKFYTVDELTSALQKAIEDQMKHNKSKLIYAMPNQELGEPFRRNAVQVARIDRAGMRPQARV